VNTRLTRCFRKGAKLLVPRAIWQHTARLRKTFGYHLLQKKNNQRLWHFDGNLGHSSAKQITKRYIGKSMKMKLVKRYLNFRQDILTD